MTREQIAVGQEVIVFQKGRAGRPKPYTGTVVSMNKTIFTIDTKGKLESFHWSDMTTVGQGKITVELLPILAGVPEELLPIGGDAMPRESVTEEPAIINPEFEQAVQAPILETAPETAPETVYAPEGITDALADIICKFNLEHKRGYDEGYAAGKEDVAKALMDALEAC
ncbi:hypothetical protein FDZ71_12870 [bacterium]|nr:MAG: hypothetical protein FDZ71_12870 [bacterium]